MNARIEFRQDEIAAFCQRWQMVELALFGSVLRDDFGPESDVDILVRFAPAAEPGLRDWPAMERELAEVLGRDVDLIERRAILDSAQVVYAA